MQFHSPQHVRTLTQRVLDFIDDEVIPVETEARLGDGLTPGQLHTLRQKARDAGIYAPQLPEELGGLGLNIEEWVPIFEAAGRSLLGPLALNCAAPDEGNMHLLHALGTAEQKERYLQPLAAGEIRSCFCMTEPPPGAGSDPTMIKTRAERRGDRWVIDGHKWWSTGADGAGVYLVMARSNPDVPPRDGCTIFLVDADNPGLRVERHIGGLNHGGPGGHCEVRLDGCEVPHDAILGEEGRGYAHAQERLGPARLTHCMRWTGVAQRALEIAGDYVLQREGFGSPLAHHQSLQWMIADSEMELHAGRLMVRHAAWLINNGHKAKQESSMAKVFVAETVNRVVDRAVQMCGGTGVSDLTPLADFYREARSFRIYDGASEVHRMVIARRWLKQRRQTQQ
ncbi:MAG: acyl-CoA dehydrogenase family protein [Candidatus Promineifilaceae bacterium]|nr:acyl-CoA dehydrogenase family protein [Candidatus Promineifilaceae bacterium]